LASVIIFSLPADEQSLALVTVVTTRSMLDHSGYQALQQGLARTSIALDF